MTIKLKMENTSVLEFSFISIIFCTTLYQCIVLTLDTFEWNPDKTHSSSGIMPKIFIIIAVPSEKILFYLKYFKTLMTQNKLSHHGWTIHLFFEI